MKLGKPKIFFLPFIIVLFLLIIGCTQNGPIKDNLIPETVARLAETADQVVEDQAPTNEFIYALPYKVGSAYVVCQGYHGSITHYGDWVAYATDWEMPEDTEILAARGGTVTEVVDRFGVGSFEEKDRNRSNYVVVKHDDGTFAYYGHHKKGTAKVRVGTKVEKGTALALVGCSGFCMEPHLHFQVFKYTKPGEMDTIPVKFQLTPTRVGEAIEGIEYIAPGKDLIVDPAAKFDKNSLVRFPEKVLAAINKYKDDKQAALAFQKILEDNDRKLKKMWQELQKKALDNDAVALDEVTVFLNYALQKDPRFERVLKPTPYDPESGDGGDYLPGVQEVLLILWGMISSD